MIHDVRALYRYISATDWGTFAGVGSNLHEIVGQHDCSHRVYTSYNSTMASSFANHQWMQSIIM